MCEMREALQQEARQSRHKHQNRCSEIQRNKEVRDLKASVAELEKRERRQGSGPSVAANGNSGRNTAHDSNLSNNNASNNVNVTTINNFGQESLDYVRSNKEFLTSSIVYKTMEELIRQIHCNPEHPENHNVLMETRLDGEWIVTSQDDTLTDLIQSGYRILNTHARHDRDHLLDGCEDDLDELADVRRWLESAYDDDRTQRPIKRKLLLLFINNRTMLLGKD